MTLKISAKDSIHSKLIKNLNFKEKHTSKENLFYQIDSLSLLFEKIGFLNNRLDTVIKSDSIYTARFNLGNSVKKIRVYYDQNLIRKEIIQQVSTTFTNAYFEVDIDNLQETLTTLVSLYEERGNSFTEIKLDNVTIASNTIEATLIIKSLETRYIDKVIIRC